MLLRTYLLRRDQGNVLIYNSPGIAEAAEAIARFGGADRLLINHAHEGMYGSPAIDVSVFVHESDRAGLGDSVPITGTFTRRTKIDDDLEVLPTPGHTAGTTSYLWDSGVHRFLFTGDFIWLENGEWKAVVLDERLRESYLQSLALVRDLDFDVMVPWGATDDGPPVSETTPASTRRRVGTIITRLENGESR
ncbi:MBL fold metallo-hydrolase [Leifsonia sp. NPDC056665]|uniref:MBL fold metallo-hydrolase n=1 Tax=Leifsonia sp. NPDC056665 TaxID=3345901 RepID=UPI0036A70E1A